MDVCENCKFLKRINQSTILGENAVIASCTFNPPVLNNKNQTRFPKIRFPNEWTCSKFIKKNDEKYI